LREKERKEFDPKACTTSNFFFYKMK